MKPYPLFWPDGWTRSGLRQTATVLPTLPQATTLLLKELRLFKAVNVVISTNAVLGRSGLPLGRQPKIQDPGVAVYFAWRLQNYVIACDRWTTVAANINSIAHTIKSLRTVDRLHGTVMINRFMSTMQRGSYQQPPPPPPPPPPSPPPKPSGVRTWREVFGLVNKVATYHIVYGRYRELAKEKHPDRQGGSTEAFQELQTAFEQAKKYFGFNN